MVVERSFTYRVHAEHGGSLHRIRYSCISGVAFATLSVHLVQINMHAATLNPPISLRLLSVYMFLKFVECGTVERSVIL